MLYCFFHCILIAGSSQQKPELLMSRTDTSLSVCFLDWVVELSHLLTLTRGISVRRCPSMVRTPSTHNNIPVCCQRTDVCIVSSFVKICLP